MIGIRLADRTFFPVLDERTPVSRRVALIPAADRQTKAQIVVLRDDAEELGTLFLDGLSGTTKNEAEIRLTLEIDDSGVVSMTARDLETGNTDSRVARLDDYHTTPAVLVTPKSKSPWPLVALIALLLVLGTALFFAIRGLVNQREGEPSVDTASQNGAPAPTEPAATADPPVPAEPSASAGSPDTGDLTTPEGSVDAPAAEPVATSDQVVSGVEYLIQSGDTLWDISERHYGSPWLYPDIAGENRIPDPDWIYPEDVIVLPAR